VNGALKAQAVKTGPAKAKAGTASAAGPKKRSSGGRPSQEAALRRDERLIEIAAAMFMQRGFDATSIDAVAEAASVGKATLYARYHDKAALFAAVFQRQIVRTLAPLDESLAASISGDVEDALLTISRNMMAVAMTPEALAIKRIMISQAIRFPELARMAHVEGWQRSTAATAAVLRHFAEKGQICVENPELAADLFLSLVAGRQSTIAMLGIEIDRTQIDQRIEAAVKLFLDGARKR
jgi:AcrR family transcriptional regulator